MKFTFTPCKAGTKVADAELHFTDGPLAGLKLIGFAIWVSRHGSGWIVTLPARHYTVHGERHSFALLRSSLDPLAIEPLKARVLEAYYVFAGIETEVAR